MGVQKRVQKRVQKPSKSDNPLTRGTRAETQLEQRQNGPPDRGPRGSKNRQNRLFCIFGIFFLRSWTEFNVNGTFFQILDHFGVQGSFQTPSVERVMFMGKSPKWGIFGVQKGSKKGQKGVILDPILDPPQSHSKLGIMGIWGPKGGPKRGPKWVQKWSKMGSQTPKWVIFGPPSETPLFNSISGFSCVLAKKGSKRGQKGVKKGSKRGQNGPFWGPKWVPDGK